MALFQEIPVTPERTPTARERAVDETLRAYFASGVVTQFTFGGIDYRVRAMLGDSSAPLFLAVLPPENDPAGPLPPFDAIDQAAAAVAAIVCAGQPSTEDIAHRLTYFTAAVLRHTARIEHHHREIDRQKAKPN